MADSLAAIKKLVFDEGRITPAELADALESNFAGEQGEKIRQMLVNDAPKYGNDDDSVDQLVVDAYDSYIDEIKKYPNTRHGRGPIGGIRYAGTSSISANVGQGMGTMATPDGRHAHEPLAEGCSPAHNADTHGPTAVFKSVSKLPTEKITGGVLLLAYTAYVIWQIVPGLELSAEWCIEGACVSAMTGVSGMALLVFGMTLAMRQITASPLTRLGLVGAPPAPPRR